MSVVRPSVIFERVSGQINGFFCFHNAEAAMNSDVITLTEFEFVISTSLFSLQYRCCGVKTNLHIAFSSPCPLKHRFTEAQNSSDVLESP